MSSLARNFSLIALLLITAGALWAFGKAWLADHPEHDPAAPFTLTQRDGWATDRKLTALRSDPAVCRAVLVRSGVSFTKLNPIGEGTCRRADRMTLDDGLPLRPRGADATCAVKAGTVRWLQQRVQPVAIRILGSRVTSLEHLGTGSCRRIGGGETGTWSEHAMGNAIDIAAFRLADGRRISVLDDWSGQDRERRAFLRAAHAAACRDFGTVLGPEYNTAHRDHFHLDQALRGWGTFCR
ncbi:extensin-like protein [Novosphingobium kunmingense]|uniref:Extensin-like protein n=1 Tax=Novosphingobium kunmingense TaxID=1211806 RepID=A0A2N0I1X3_9SPHN|nr:extensin family protein [Novosphingobium kunmingense]PKB25181.1 extensin-like protein [Novosphingobium kunmingense]